MARKTAEDQIALLEAKIKAIKEKAERKSVLKNPAVKPMSAALRYIDKALNATEDGAIRKSLDEARATVSSCLAISGVTPKSAKRLLGRRAARGVSAAPVDPDELLAYLRNNPGQRSEDITAELKSDATSLRTAMKGLIEDGKVRIEGQRRGTRYFASDKRNRAAQ